MSSDSDLIHVEDPILSLKGVSFIPVCICPDCGERTPILWQKNRGRLRDWAAYHEEIHTIICSNAKCLREYEPNYAIRIPDGVPILTKSELLNEMVSWFRRVDREERSIDLELNEDEILTWDRFYKKVPDWQEHIPIELFTNILRYTPPNDLEGVLLGRPAIPLFGGFFFPKSLGNSETY
ncbi:hypothetical protein [Leptospira inadai]|nr:hypothetical protein [Leptospira inadai]